MSVITFPGETAPLRGAFVRELLARRDAAEIIPARERYELRGWAGGYRITEWGSVIATFHGPRFDLAAGLLRNLKAEAEAAPTPAGVV